MDAANLENYLSQIAQLDKQGLDSGEIILNLRRQNIPENIVDEAMQEWKKIGLAKKGTRALFIAVLGLVCWC